MDAHALRRHDWTISAIVRHLDMTARPSPAGRSRRVADSATACFGSPSSCEMSQCCCPSGLPRGRERSWAQAVINYSDAGTLGGFAPLQRRVQNCRGAYPSRRSQRSV